MQSPWQDLAQAIATHIPETHHTTVDRTSNFTLLHICEPSQHPQSSDKSTLSMVFYPEEIKITIFGQPTKLSYFLSIYDPDLLDNLSKHHPLLRFLASDYPTI